MNKDASEPATVLKHFGIVSAVLLQFVLHVQASEIPKSVFSVVQTVEVRLLTSRLCVPLFVSISVRDLFETVDNRVVIDVIKVICFYSLL